MTSISTVVTAAPVGGPVVAGPQGDAAATTVIHQFAALVAQSLTAGPGGQPSEPPADELPPEGDAADGGEDTGQAEPTPCDPAAGVPIPLVQSAPATPPTGQPPTGQPPAGRADEPGPGVPGTTGPTTTVAGPQPPADPAAAPDVSAHSAVSSAAAAVRAAPPTDVPTAAVAASMLPGPAPTAGPAPAEAVGPAAAQVFPEVLRLVSRDDGTHRLTLRLHPEELGEVRVAVTIRDGAVHIDLAAGPEAQESLRNGSTELRRLLELVGSAAGQVVVRDLPVASTGGSHAPQPGGPTGQPTAGSDQRSGDGTSQHRDNHAGGPPAPDHPHADDHSAVARIATPAPGVDLRL